MSVTTWEMFCQPAAHMSVCVLLLQVFIQGCGWDDGGCCTGTSNSVQQHTQRFRAQQNVHRVCHLDSLEIRHKAVLDRSNSSSCSPVLSHTHTHTHTLVFTDLWLQNGHSIILSYLTYSKLFMCLRAPELFCAVRWTLEESERTI